MESELGHQNLSSGRLRVYLVSTLILEKVWNSILKVRGWIRGSLKVQFWNFGGLIWREVRGVKLRSSGIELGDFQGVVSKV